MGPGLLFVTLLGLTFTVHGQTPPPEPPSITIPFPDPLPENLPGPDILPLPDDGGLEPTPLATEPAVRDAIATDVPQASNIQVGAQDFAEQVENSSSSAHSGQALPVTNISPKADILPGQPTTEVKSGNESSDDSQPRNNTLADLQHTAKFIVDQIRDLDAQLLALDNAYRSGQITRSTRDVNAVANRRRHRQFEGDLRTIMIEINRLVPPAPPSVRPPADRSASPSYEALRQELLRLRLRERLILRQLQMLLARNSRLLGRGRVAVPRSAILRRRPVTRRINFTNTPRFVPRRTLTGSVAEGNVPNSPMRIL